MFFVRVLRTRFLPNPFPIPSIIINFAEKIAAKYVRSPNIRRYSQQIRAGIPLRLGCGCHSMAIVLLLAAPLENRTGNVNLRALVHRVQVPMYGYYTADEIEEIRKKRHPRRKHNPRHLRRTYRQKPCSPRRLDESRKRAHRSRTSKHELYLKN
jgi:hypothetical protein